MRKVEISIDLTAIKGAQRMTSNSGKDILVIDLAASRAKPHQNGKVYFNLEAIENKNGPNDYGNTHFVKEKATKEERDAREDLPFLGNGKLFDSEAFREEQPRQERREPQERRQAPRPAASRTPAPQANPEHFEPCEDDDIPF
jgi:hypothetical protein